MVECHQIHEAFELQISEINTNTANKYSKYLKLMAYEIHKANNIHSLNTCVDYFLLLNTILYTI